MGAGRRYGCWEGVWGPGGGVGVGRVCGGRRCGCWEGVGGGGVGVGRVCGGRRWECWDIIIHVEENHTHITLIVCDSNN